jgi:hypothetical protein
MADPIPRNSRADQNANVPRVEPERRGNRPLFGEGIGGGLRARIENAQQPRQNQNPFAQRPAQAQPQARPVPVPPPRPNPPAGHDGPRGWAQALRRAAERPAQARRRQQPLQWFGDQLVPLRRAVGHWMDGVTLGQRLVLLGVTLAAAVVLQSAVIAPLTSRSEPVAVSADDAGPLLASPMIPAPAPVEACTVIMNSAEVDADRQMSDTRHALVAHISIAARGCAGQMLRAAVWIFQAEDQPLAAPAADPVYRSPLNHLTVQSLLFIDENDVQLERTLALPHMQFPAAIGSPLWLTVGVQVWHEGRPAAAGSMHVEQVYFTRVE